MPETAIGLRREVALEPDPDAAELEHATSQLREELFERVDRPTEPAPRGRRGNHVAAFGTLIVGAGRGAIGPGLTAVQSCLASRSVKITIGGDSLELTHASHEDQRRRVESFLGRRSP